MTRLELFTFRTGTTSLYYVDDSEDFELGSLTFKSTPIRREEKSESGAPQDGSDSSQVRIVISTETDLIRFFVLSLPESKITVEIDTIFLNDDGTKSLFKLFKGSLISSQVGRTDSSLECQPAISKFGASIPFMVYSAECNYQLYDSNCGVVKSLYRTKAVVQDVHKAAGKILLKDDLGRPDGYFNGGVIVVKDSQDSPSYYRHIAKQEGSNIYIILESIGLKRGDKVELYPGCNFTRDHCQNKFNNLSKYGGFSEIPINNPSQTGI